MELKAIPGIDWVKPPEGAVDVLPEDVFILPVHEDATDYTCGRHPNHHGATLALVVE